MKAVVVTGPDEFEIRDQTGPPAGDGALLRVLRTGVCGTDMKVLGGKIPVHHPLVMGHEAIAEVVEPGPRGLTAVGDLVLVDPAVACGYCDLCRAGRVHICRNGGLLGRDMDGVFANLARVPEERLIAVPPSVSGKAGGVLQVLGTVVHAQRAISPFPGDVAVVIGLGVSGLLSVQLLVARGVTVIGVTRSAWKRDLAKTFGAAAVAPPDEAAAAVGDLTGGRGVDLAVEAVGQERTLAQAIELTRIGGEVLVFGTLTGGTEGLPYYQFYFKELMIHNPRAAMATDYERAVALAAQGVLDLEPIVTHEFPLSEAGRAFEAVRDSSSLKVVMIPE